MQPAHKTALITDIDNTLFDWHLHWDRAFREFLSELSNSSGIDATTLKRDIKEVHQRHGTSECFYFVNEIDCLKEKFPSENLHEKFLKAIEQYRAQRDHNLVLYPTVLETLNILKNKGCLLIGYSDSQSMHSIYRVKKLGLDGVLDYLFTPPTHAIDLEDPDLLDAISEYEFKLEETNHCEISSEHQKPSRKAIEQIFEVTGISRQEVIYIGDSLPKDIRAAQDSEIDNVYAEYGSSHKKPEYPLLIEVSHWTRQDVDREQMLKRANVKPTYVAEQYFSEILQFFIYLSAQHLPSHARQDSVANQVNIYKSIVDVQKHFNDIEIRIRALGFSFLGVVAGAVGVALRYRPENGSSFASEHLATMFLLVALVIWVCIWFMDRHWYHRLLYGAIKEGIENEKWLKRYGFQAQLTEQISQTSPLSILGRNMHSKQKIDLFYLFPGAVMAGGAGLMLHGTLFSIVCIAALALALKIFSSGT